MKNKIKNFLISSLFLLLTFLLLAYPKESLSLSATGLQLWFNRMIPTLLPFMILSGIMIKLNLTENFVRLLTPVLNPIFKLSLNGLYAAIIGFLCGFPMGAKVIADLYSSNKISKKEASLLLGFCNNIGPIYFISFVLTTLELKNKVPYLLGMYALPLLYGLFLRYTRYNGEFQTAEDVIAAASFRSVTFLDALDDSIMSGLLSIAKLGGYMILFNLLNLIPAILAPHSVFNYFFEITSTISRLGSDKPLLILLLLPIGGFSCISQTYSMIKETDLSLKHYIYHKVILTGLTLLYYECWHLFSPSTFLL